MREPRQAHITPPKHVRNVNAIADGGTNEREHMSR